MFYYSIRGDDRNGWVMTVFKYINDAANPQCVTTYSRPEEFDTLVELLKRQNEYVELNKGETNEKASEEIGN